MTGRTVACPEATVSLRKESFSGRLIHCLFVVLLFSILYGIFFSPVLFNNRLLAPGEGWSQSFPAFTAKRTLWTPFLWGGLPAAADPTMQSWYPVALFFSGIAHSWNAFVVSAYVLASSFTYGLIYSITRSRLASLAGGIIYGMCGFMMAHLPHTSMVHTAVWLPLLLWALTELRSRLFSPWWLLASSVSVACSVLAGHPQIFVFTLGVGVVYMLFSTFSKEEDRWRYCALAAVSMTLGVGLAAVQLLPSAELTGLTHRSGLSYADFTSYALHPLQTIQLMFPYLFGGVAVQGAFYKYSYFGLWNLAELSGYVGLLPPMMVVIALFGKGRRSMVWFWTAFGVGALLLSFGGSTPLGKLMYYVPAYNKFRAPARHLLELSLAASILTGLGIKAMQDHLLPKAFIRKIVIAAALVMISGLMIILLFSAKIHAVMASKGVAGHGFLPWSNPAVGIPMIISVMTGFSLLLWAGKVDSKMRQVLLLTVLIVDLASFGWFGDWRYYSPGKASMNTSPTVEKYREILQRNHQRLLPVRGEAGVEVEIMPNISRYRGVPSISGYGPFIYPRLGDLVPMGTTGRVWGDWAALGNQSLNILATRFIFLPRGDIKPAAAENKEGTFSAEDLNVTLGAGCGISHPRDAAFILPAGVTASSLHVVSSLACSTNTLQNRPVARVLLETAAGESLVFDLAAGRDTAEWAYDCSDVTPLMKHDKATVHKSYPVTRASNPCLGHHYRTRFAFGKPVPIAKLRVHWTGESESIVLHKISLRDDARGISYPLGMTTDSIANTARWRHIEDAGDTSIYENLLAMPRAWLTPAAVSLRPEDIFKAIKSSVMPDGSAFDPRAVALVEEPLALQGKGAEGTARVVHIDDTAVEVLTDTTSSAFLVLSDMYYPGWKATIDGIPTHLFRADYILRGVMVPAGGHIVRFEYVPQSFYSGILISAASLLAILGLLFFVIKGRRDDN